TYKSQKVESILSLMSDNGTPIEVQKAVLGTFQKTKLVTLESCGNKRFCAYVTFEDKNLIQDGQKVFLANKNQFFGKVVQVSKNQNNLNGMFLVVVENQNKEALKILDDQKFLVSEIITSTFGGVIALPHSAFVFEEDGLYVWKVKEDRKTVEKVKVQSSDENYKTKLVRSGINEGDLIITRGQSQIKEFPHVQIIEDAVSEKNHEASI
ncbi:MAG: efflux RND transporter periplasmic adaptor subunit, partial [Bdellovibrionales bacterium]|nr:efflux RND transporter periplasmic adaptor subunit [Bdellovibrionales bacterium]